MRSRVAGMFMRSCWAILFALALGAVSTRADRTENAVVCSIVNLLATPERFVGKRVATYGYAVAEFEGTATYLSESDMRRRSTVNAIWLARSDQSPRLAAAHERYAFVEGVFDADRGHADVFGGTIREITEVSVVAPPATGPSQVEH